MNLREARKQVNQALREPEFLRRCIDILYKERRVKEAEAKRCHDDWKLENLSTFRLLKLDAEIIDYNRALYSTFEEFVSQLPQPPLIAADDLQEVALAQLGGVTDETKAIQKRRFIYHVLLKLSDCQTSKPNIYLGDWTNAGIKSEIGPLWGDYPTDGYIPVANGFTIDVEIKPIPGLKTFANRIGGAVSASGLIRGVCTAAAAQRTAELIGPIVESLVRSLKLATTYTELEPARESLIDLDEFDANAI